MTCPSKEKSSRKYSSKKKNVKKRSGGKSR